MILCGGGVRTSFRETLNSILKPTVCLHRLIMTSSVMKERIAFVRYEEDKQRVHVSFKFNSTYVPDNKIFSLNRCQDEPLDVTIQRLEKNIMTAADKKLKRLRKQAEKNGDPAPEEPKFDIEIISASGDALERFKTNKEAFVTGNYLSVCGQKLPIMVNAPTVVKISLPSMIMAGYPMHANVSLENARLEDCTFSWWKNSTRGETFVNYTEDEIHREASVTWLKIKGEDTIVYTPDKKDVGLKLRVVCEPRDGDKRGVEIDAVSSTVVQPPPSERPPFEDRHLHTPEVLPRNQIRVVSYNLLADMYARTPHSKTVLFKYCPEYALDINYRKLLFLKELIGYNGDILCLQEVDRSIFKYELSLVLREHGLTGVYSQKSGEAAEGVACFYRESKLDFVQSERVVLSEEIMDNKNSFLEDVRTAIMRNSELKDRVTKRSNVLQMITLNLKESDRKIIVANTHLYFHPDADHIRLLQGYSAYKIVEERVALLEQQDGVKPEVIFCGDFNSCPEFGVYQLFTTGVVTQESEDWKSNEDEIVRGLTARINRTLSSACGTPRYTNYTPEFDGCLDYIFHTDDLVVRDVVPLPDHELVAHKEYTAIPSPMFPSDHLALVTTLSFKN